MAAGDILQATVFCCVVLTTFWHPSISADCDKGWFGPNCQYKCHCADSACDNGKPCLQCAGGWFGPDCQYIDLAYNNKNIETDGNDSTCHYKHGEYTVSRNVPLNSIYPFIWLRVHVNDSEFLRDLEFKFVSSDNSWTQCINQRNVSVDSKTLDIHCDFDKLVQSVRVHRKAALQLCSLYVSGGRNVALRQLTSQSTTYFENSSWTGWQNVSFVASRAVDGDTSQDFYKSTSCSSTMVEEKTSRATFNITFSRPHRVTTYIVYYRSSESWKRRSFLLDSLDENNTHVFGNSTTYNSCNNAVVCTITSIRETQPISFVKIKANNEDNILTLCEVEIFGDSICKPGKFGRDCEHTCNCADGESCFVSTGGCPSGCASGFDGMSCDQRKVEEENAFSALSNSGAVVGAVIGVVVVVLLVVIIVIFIRKRKKRQSLTKPMLKNSIEDFNHLVPENNTIEVGLQRATATRIVPAMPSATTKGSNDKVKETNEENLAVYNNTACVKPTTSLSINELADFVKSKDKAFFQNQFNKIPANLSATMIAALSPENIHKNRYKNISAYDHSRVHLIPNVEKRHEDYINASYIEGYSSGDKFIASQGPSKLNLEDFVRMLWEQEVDKVVMLTNLVEEGKQKCEQYWPDDGEMRIGEITVQLARTQKFADYTIRRLQLKQEGQPIHDVTHFHFTTWPDKDVPTGPWGLVDFEQRVASYPTKKPIVVHCSAGVGRTGTFISLRNAMRQAEETGHMDFFTIVQKLRHNRINMVQTVDQYIFLHKAALVAFICMGTTLSATDMQNRNQTLSQKSELKKMEKEFKIICQTHDNLEISVDDDTYTADEQTQNSLKNRFSSIVSTGIYRAILECENSSHGSYINAVLVPSFIKRDQQILTQLPLPATTVDFWRLVIQYKVTLVVAFEVDLKSTDSTVGDYLPAATSQPATFSMFKLRTEPVKTGTYWKLDTVYLTVDKEKIDNVGSKKTVGEYQLTHLTCTSTKLDPGFLLSLVEQIRLLQSRCRGRIIYTCRDGATYSGLVCVLALLLDRMDNDQLLTVPLVVGAIKAIRPQVIPTLDQYRLLYQILHLYSENMSEYSNFGSLAAS